MLMIFRTYGKVESFLVSNGLEELWRDGSRKHERVFEVHLRVLDPEAVPEPVAQQCPGLVARENPPRSTKKSDGSNEVT